MLTAVHLVDVRQLRKRGLVSQRNVDDAVVGQRRDRLENGRLLATAEAGGADLLSPQCGTERGSQTATHEESSKLPVQRALSPQRAGSVPERLQIVSVAANAQRGNRRAYPELGSLVAVSGLRAQIEHQRLLAAHHAPTHGRAEEEGVELGQLFRRDCGVVRTRRRVHLSANIVRERFWHPVHLLSSDAVNGGGSLRLTGISLHFLLQP